jgi:pimeloyl-ACP methyl ester carboxylesterase
VWLDRIFSPLVTLWVFLGQVLSADHSCRAAVARLIAGRPLARPVLVGQGLGGILALALAEEQPGSVDGVVAIDGLPVMPGTEDLPPGARIRLADNMDMQVARQPASGFVARQQAFMRTIGTLDMDRADELAKLMAKSDPPSVGRYAADILTLDLRPALAAIAAPVLVVMPYFSLDAEQQGQTVDAKLDYYRALMAGTSRLQVVPVAPARHFAMFDQPQAVVDALKAFLGSL